MKSEQLKHQLSNRGYIVTTNNSTVKVTDKRISNPYLNTVYLHESRFSEIAQQSFSVDVAINFLSETGRMMLEGLTR